MAYVRRPKRKLKWHVAIPLLCLIIVLIYMIVHILFPKQDNEEGIKICTHDTSRTYSLLNKEYENIYEINDYFFYGENLTLLQNEYKLNQSDDLFGKTIQLRNLCNDKKILFQLTNKIDQQIDLGELENGFYEVYVVNNLQEYRVTSTNEINDIFYTITRNNMSKKVELISTNNYLNDIELKHNYVYINISSDLIQRESYDILIDPFGGSSDTGEVRWGYEANGLRENEEMFKAALALKEKLEEYGFVVGITKDRVDQQIDISGENGRIHLGYNKNAKLFINLQINASQYSSARGIEITHSAYSSSTLAYQIIHDLEENTSLIGSLNYPGDVQNGVVKTYRLAGLSGEKIYDPNSQIRETGGVATGAGSMNSSYQTLNSFAVNNKKGMQSLVMHLVYITNPVDYKIWTESYSDLMSSIADSIATYYQVEKEGK